MHAPSAKRGFTLIELLVVIAIIAILAAILFPVFAKARLKAEQTSCLSNQKNLATAMIMYTQDNKGYYPDANLNPLTNVGPTAVNNWAEAIQSYAGDRKIFTCPLDKSGSGAVSYAMNGCLVDATGKGINTNQVSSPAEVGLFTDANSEMWPQAGVINCNTIQGVDATGATVVPVNRHPPVAAYCDGHCEAGSFNDQVTSTALNDITSSIGQAFYQAPWYGWVDNPGAGASLATVVAQKPTGAAALKIGGSTTCIPLWQTASAAWVAMGGQPLEIGCAGSSGYPTYLTNVTTTNSGVSGTFNSASDIGGASSQQTPSAATLATWAAEGVTENRQMGLQDSDIIATDAVGMIVSNTTRLNLKSITQAEIMGLMGTTSSNAGSATTAQTMVLPAGVTQLNFYEREPGSGTRGFFESFGIGGADLPNAHIDMPSQSATAVLSPKNTKINPIPALNCNVIQVNSAQDMLKAVSADPYGIGYCSVSGEFDPNLVQVLPYQLANGDIQTYNRAAVLTGQTDMTNPSGWALTRPLFGRFVNGVGEAAATFGAPVNADAGPFMAFIHGAFQQSLLMNSGFFPARSALTAYNFPAAAAAGD